MLSFSVTFFITVANLAVLYLVLRKLLWKPLRAFMDDRAERIRRDVDEAASVKRSAEEMRQRYDDLITNADEEAEWVLRDAEDRAAVRSREIVAEAEREAEAALRRAAERSALEVARARDQLAEEIAGIAVAAASVAARKGLDGEAERLAALEFIRELGGTGERSDA
ncbi:MAG: ATP synthase F0 subunit B [Spirochaetes bacterium]|nr:ATP synthase F0 subunit B [Spirochaetota bacterium]MBU1079629.1 ATP synthase F0 subunit B [Spirochaetota bacterium]